MVEESLDKAELVRNNLIRVFENAELEIKNGVSPDEVAYILLNGREEKRSCRDRLRSTLNAVDITKYTDFEQGIKHLLDGEYSHALLGNADVLLKIGLYMENTGDIKSKPSLHEPCIQDAQEIITKAMRVIDDAWRQINSGHSKYLNSYLGK